MDESTDTGGGGGMGLITRLHLDLRGTRFTIERDTLMNLPESVLLCLFPNGLVLSRQPEAGAAGGGGGGLGDDEEDPEDDEDEVYMVDFDPKCLSFVLDFFRGAQESFYGPPGQPSRRAMLASMHAQQASIASSADLSMQMDAFGAAGVGAHNPLLSKQAIIVLREELEYFCIPPRRTRGDTTGAQGGAGTGLGAAPDAAPGTSVAAANKEASDVANDEAAHANAALVDLKRACGQALLERRQIFAALQRNVNKENNMAEQHLIDMLCMSGFDREDAWGFRALEPSRCCITSIALVLLKTGITADESAAAAAAAAAGQAESHTAEASASEDAMAAAAAAGDLQIDHQQLATAQKLLLFWRKPARKCWWDGAEVVLPLAPGTSPSPADSAIDASAGMTRAEAELLQSGKGRKVTVWARRVWTLELSLL